MKKLPSLLVAFTLAVGLTAGGAVASQASWAESSHTPSVAQAQSVAQAWCIGPHCCWYWTGSSNPVAAGVGDRVALAIPDEVSERSSRLPRG